MSIPTPSAARLSCLMRMVKDISARSPVLQPDAIPSRTSLDSRASRKPRSAVSSYRFDKPDPADDEGFEDVGLNDETKPRKRGFLSRFNDSSDGSKTPEAKADSGHHGFHLPGRKRGQSGAGAELGSIERPSTANRVKEDGVVR